MRVLAACLLSLALLPGCATRNNYLVNRAADFSDILRIHVMFGPGIAYKLEATRLLHLGGAYTQNSFAWGWHNRAIGAWRESIRSWGLVVGHHEEETSPIDRNSGDYGWTFGEGGMAFQPASEEAFDLDLLTFRGTLMVIVGIDVEVRLGEVIDFVAGIFQFDPAGDERDYESMRQADLPEEPAPPERAEEAEPGSEN